MTVRTALCTASEAAALEKSSAPQAVLSMPFRSNPTIPAHYQTVLDECAQRPRVWLITGVAGFIGSNLLEQLLALRQTVIGLDNFSSGKQENIDEVLAMYPEAAGSFRMIQADIRDLESCLEACRGVDIVLHQAAVESEPLSIADPATSHDVNVSGFLNMLIAAREAEVARFVYASSSSVYGDVSLQPHIEEHLGTPLSPHAVTKSVNELYALVFQRAYGLESIGLRYFNVFGRRQNAEGEDAAVIPRWIRSLLTGTRCRIFGNGDSTRDFCFIANAVQANILAAIAPESATNQVYNVACGESTTLNELFRMIRLGLAGFTRTIADDPVYEAFRPEDIQCSLASIERAKDGLGYAPSHSVSQGLSETIEWFVRNNRRGDGHLVTSPERNDGVVLEGVV